jgi:hypothetical protein
LFRRMRFYCTVLLWLREIKKLSDCVLVLIYHYDSGMSIITVLFDLRFTTLRK